MKIFKSLFQQSKVKQLKTKPSTLKIWISGVLTGAVLFNSAAYADREIDDQVKAMFLYNFSNFVDWPAEAFKNADSQLTLCIVGDPIVMDYLRVFDETPIRDRILSLGYYETIQTLPEQCHVLYLSADASTSFQAAGLSNKYGFVLSVSREEKFMEGGGIVRIVRTSDQAEFDINLAEAMEKGLFISSDLLSLARFVKR
ncbi:MAG: YfiR family protein [Pseudomonadota bacterium]